MTWSEFNTAVRVHLVAHNRRQGIQTLIDSLIKAGVWDLQASIPHYAGVVKRSFASGSLRPNGFVAQGTLPSGVKVLDVYVQDGTDETLRARYNIVDSIEELSRMETGEAGAYTYRFYYDPRTGVFTVSPKPSDSGSVLKLEYSGKRLDFDNDDDVLFDEKTAEAVGNFVNARLALQVDREGGLASAFNSLYVANKRKLHSELNAAQLTPKQSNLT